MITESLEERIAKADALAVKGKAVAARHRADADVHTAKGRHGKAADCLAKAERQDVLVSGHERKAGLLRGQMRGVTARQQYTDAARVKASLDKQLRPTPDPLVVYSEAMMHVSELQSEVEGLKKKAEGYARQGDTRRQGLVLGHAKVREGYIPDWLAAAQEVVVSSGRDLHREYAVARKARLRKEERDHAEDIRLSRLGVETDDRTAAGQRVYVSPTSKTTVANLASYNELITLPKERTPRRLDTLYRFDMLCGKAEAGLFPELSMESESKSTGGPGPNVMLSRVEGLDELRDIEEVIGSGNVRMLRAWIFETKSMTQLVREGFGTERTISRLTLAALDALQVYWRTGDALRARMKAQSTANRASA